MCIVSLQENKTPYQLAVEQNHTSVAAMLADYRDNGPSALQAYEKKRARPSRDEKVNYETSWSQYFTCDEGEHCQAKKKQVYSRQET